MFPTLFAGAAACLLSSSLRLFFLAAIALLIFLFPLRALALVAGLVLTAVAVAFLFIIIKGNPS